MSTIIDLITQFRVQFFDKFPYVSSYVYSLNPVCTDRVPTMAVDRTGNMYWNPEWCETLSLDQGAYVVQHETWHLILRHCHLAKDVLGDNPDPQDQYDMNVAMDVVIWEMLECVKEHAPEGGVTLANAQERWPAIKPNMTCLEIYHIIREARQQPDLPGQGTPTDGEVQGTEDNEVSTEGSDTEDGQESGDGDGDGGASSEQGTEASEDTGGGSDTGRQGSQSGGTDGDSTDGQGEGVDGEVQDYGYQGVMDGGSAADGQPRDYEVEQPASWDAYMEDQLLESIEQRIEEYERDPEWEPHSNWGTVGGLLKGTIRAKLRPQPDPWKAMRAAIGLKVAGNLGDAEDTYQVRNRRQSSVQDKVILKGEKVLTPDVVVVMDTSGSMSRTCLTKCSVVCMQGCRAVGQYRLICWDGELQHEEVVRGSKTDWPTPGGGGTTMEDAIRYALQYKPAVIILCTDGGTYYPEKEELGRTQLIIALTQDMPTPDWAKRVRIPDEGKTDEV